MGEDYSALLTAIAESSLGQRNWTDTLDLVTAKLGVAGAGIVPLKGSRTVAAGSTEFAEAINAYSRNGWDKQDVRYRGVQAALRRGGVGTDWDFISEREMDRHPYYQDWLRPFGLKWFSGIFIRGYAEEWVLSLQKPLGSAAFTEMDMQNYRRLADELATTVSMCQFIDDLRNQSVLEGFRASGKAAIVVNRHGKPIGMTAAAERMLSAGDVTITQAEIRCRDRSCNVQLTNALSAVRRGLLRSHVHIYVRRNDLPPLIMTIIPAPPAIANLILACHAYILLSDPAAPRASPALHFASAFGLTGQEADVAALLAKGLGLREIGVETGISYETVRTYIRRLFAKTGVNSQKDLVSTLIRIGEY